MKKITFENEVKEGLLSGINPAVKAIGKTFGLKGRLALLRSIQTDASTGGRFPNWKFSKDGVSVARDIFFDDHVQDTGVSMVRAACVSTVNTAGDGTTLTAVMCGAVMNGAYEAIKNGANPVLIKKGVQSATEIILEGIKKNAIQIKDKDGVVDNERAKQIALISANSDEEVGNVVADAIRQVGADGMITVEPSNDYKTSVEKAEGALLGAGLISPYFITDQTKQRCELNYPYVLLYDRTLDSFKPLMPLIKEVVDAKASLLIVCQDCKNEALSTLVTNHLRGGLKVAVVKMTDFGVQKRKVLEDMAIVVDGLFCSEEKGIKLERVKLKDLGRAEKIIVDKNDTIIMPIKLNIEEGKTDLTKEEEEYLGHKGRLVDYLSDLKQQIENETDDNAKQLVKDRYSKMVGGVAVIRVGGRTNDEIVEKIDRVDDALCASRSAIKGGIVAGGGSLYCKLSNLLNGLDLGDNDMNKGVSIVYDALFAPLEQLLSNAGVTNTEIIKEVSNEDIGVGYNLATDKIENLLDAGVVDSAMVLRVALENAIASSELFIMTDVAIVPIR